ncbi:MAG TPA: type II toxin-antitoxin system VapC family toxin [Sphingomonas sp.]|nr:type II toxin-antitoxin system VapC family toxin [Sphingomonas sp.]
MTRIVDTSVVVKWVVAEEDSALALRLIGGDIVAPDLLKAELANALWKKVRRDQIGAVQAAAAFEEVLAILPFAPSADLARRALEIGLEAGHPIYDCHFLALAEMIGATVITADERLVARCAGTRYATLLEPLGALSQENADD